VTVNASAQSQPATATEAKQKLTGGASRVWVHEKTTKTMGTLPEGCTAGRIYRFAQENSTLTISECKDGKMIKSSHTWALKQQTPLDMVLTVDNVLFYKVSFRDNGQEHLMRLRSDTDDSKTTPNTDLEFKLGAD
jgi:hypothetical protein